ncbi:MAG: FHA domain-containing protein [Planctomycetales bacterium]|nr:FHA domain-containing protein [Planctomycetales bacterium]
MPSLFVIRGNDQGARVEVDATPFSLGRDTDASFQLHDTEVSRRHAEIRRAGGSYLLVDTDSSNGTFANGHRVVQHTLNSGDQLQLGGTVLLYTQPAESSATRRLLNVNIIGQAEPVDGSRIVSSISHEEGSRIFAAGQLTPWLARARNNLQVVYDTALAVSHTLDIDELLRRILQLVFDSVDVDRGCVMLIDADTGRLEPKAYLDRADSPGGETIRISQTILDYVLETREGVLTSNAVEDDRWDSAASILQLGVREAICVPMQGRYDVVGAIYIDTTTPAADAIRRPGVTRLGDDHLKLLIAIAHQAALAVEDTRYYSAMVQAERLAAVGQTIATLSHHIKNILQGVRGGSYLIELGLTDHDEEIIRKGWDIVEKNQTKISNLVLDMLTFSKEREPDLQETRLNETIADVVELMQTRAADLEVRLTWSPDESIPMLILDPDGVHRAVLNLVTNALDACDSVDDPLVEVATRWCPDDGVVHIIVADNGVGMSSDEVERMFTIFVSKKGGRGTGLGLPVTHKIVHEHGGRLDVETEPGQGSRFVIELPATLPTGITQPHTTAASPQADSRPFSLDELADLESLHGDDAGEFDADTGPGSDFPEDE